MPRARGSMSRDTPRDVLELGGVLNKASSTSRNMA